MPRFLRAFLGAEQKNADRVNRYEGFTGEGAVVLRDGRGTVKAEIPEASEKSLTLGADPLAIYKPTGSKSVDAAKAMASFTGWSFAAVNAIASEVSNIQFRLYRVTGKDHEERPWHKDKLRCLVLANSSSGASAMPRIAWRRCNGRPLSVFA